MGFCTDEEYHRFLRQCPAFERMLIDDGVILVKYWFSVSDEEQERRFKERVNVPLKRWKLSEMDLEGRNRWVAYSKAKDEMFAHCDLPDSPVVRGRGRRQEAGPAQLHRSPPLGRAVRRPQDSQGQTSPPPARRGLSATTP